MFDCQELYSSISNLWCFKRRYLGFNSNHISNIDVSKTKKVFDLKHINKNKKEILIKKIKVNKIIEWKILNDTRHCLSKILWKNSTNLKSKYIKSFQTFTIFLHNTKLIWIIREIMTNKTWWHDIPWFLSLI